MKLNNRPHDFARELDMYIPVMSLFAQIDIVVAEVPFFGKHIDLIFASPTFRSLYAVEAKLHDWRGAFKQAALNQLAVQRSYIAVPASLGTRLAENERDLFTRHNVGLIAAGDDASVLISATRNGSFSLRHHRILKQMLHKAQSKTPKRLGDAINALSERSQTLVLLQARAN